MIVYITSEIVILAYILDAEESNADILRGHSDMTSSIVEGVGEVRAENEIYTNEIQI